MEKPIAFETFLQGIADNIRRERLARGWTQSDMQDQAGIGLRFYQRLERGNYHPTLLTLHKLADVFGLDIKDLMPPNP